MASDTPKRTYQDDSGPYMLPNDAQEHKRLDDQYRAFFKVMGKTFHAPIRNPKKILDVGCGTGILTAELARRYPNAEIIGVDIAPVPVALHGDLPNLTYVQGDIKKLVEQNEGAITAGTFDYVFSRLMMFAITDWSDHVKRLVSLLSPGGWLEMHDFDHVVFAGPNQKDFPEGTGISTTWDWHKHFTKDCLAVGLDMSCGRRLVNWMDGAGAANVSEQLYHFSPLGHPTEDETEKEFWEKTKLTQCALIDKVCSRQNSPEVVARLKEEMLETLSVYKEGDHATMHVAICQGR